MVESENEDEGEDKFASKLASHGDHREVGSPDDEQLTDTRLKLAFQDHVQIRAIKIFGPFTKHQEGNSHNGFL